MVVFLHLALCFCPSLLGESPSPSSLDFVLLVLSPTAQFLTFWSMVELHHPLWILRDELILHVSIAIIYNTFTGGNFWYMKMNSMAREEEQSNMDDTNFSFPTQNCPRKGIYMMMKMKDQYTNKPEHKIAENLQTYRRYGGQKITSYGVCICSFCSHLCKQSFKKAFTGIGPFSR